MGGALRRLVDLREGEARVVAQVFFALFALVGAHTILETARDALFLDKLPPSRLTFVYVLLAMLALVVTSINARFVARVGRRNALVFTLMIAAYGTTLFHFQPQTPRIVFGLYVWSGLLGTVLVVQFWMMAGQLFTVSQGKRLFGPIAAGGVLGAVVGASTAAAALEVMPVAALLLVSSGLFLATAIVLTTVRVAEEQQVTAAAHRSSKAPTDAAEGSRALFRDNPYLLRLAILTIVATAAVLTTDYLFKASAAAQGMAPRELGRFFARYYAVLNAVSLVVQLLLAGSIVRRLGVVAAVMVLPALLVAGGSATALAGGAFLPVLVTKGADGSLRHSLNRVTTELLYMPLSASVRDRGKAIIDSVLVRGAQALTAALILLLATFGLAKGTILGAIVAALSLVWVGMAVGLRSPYLDLFRQALARGTLDMSKVEELDMTSIEVVLEALSSTDPLRVVAAIELLEERGRSRLIPGLILYHDSEDVLLRALGVTGACERRDWIPLIERLLSRGHSERVRVAAVRVLAQGMFAEALAPALEDPSPAVRAHAAFCIAHCDAAGDPVNDPRVVELCSLDGEAGKQARLALLDAIGDHADMRWADLVVKLADSDDAEVVERAAFAIGRIKDARFVPLLMRRLAHREGREGIRDALVEVGEPALDALERALGDPATDPRVRLHIPRSVARFASQRAADILAGEIARGHDGRLRYKALRGLGRLARVTRVRVDRALIEVELRKNLTDHLRFLALWVPLDRGRGELPARAEASGGLVRGLLEDKMRQSLERAFRLLQIAHRDEDIRGVYGALRSSDKRARANAHEFLDALAAQTVGDDLRGMFRLVVDDLPAVERVARGAPFIDRIPTKYEETLAILLHDADESLAAISAYHALELDAVALRDEVAQACVDRPSLSLISASPIRLEPAGAYG